MTNHIDKIRDKMVTLHDLGVIVIPTDRPAIVNGKPSDSIVWCKDIKSDDEYMILTCVIEDAPETIRRDSFDWHPDH
jgi:hypothetical protein